jgi:hypothetical protein
MVSETEIVLHKGNKITFTTDCPEFKNKLTIDETIDTLKEKFNISNFEINVHSHPGIKKDKDISFEVKDKNKKEEIKKFIVDNFYNLNR